MHQAGLRHSYDIRLRQGIGCRSLSGKRGVGVDVPLDMLPRLFVGAPYRLGRLPLEVKGNDMVRVLMHGRWRKVGGVVHRGKHFS